MSAAIQPTARAVYDIAILGAGINGAGIARDAAMRGLRTLLFDAADIASGASAHSTRLIHGGLRYLEHMELSLVRESLRERETLLRIAPHLVKPLPLLIPIYKHDKRGPRMVRAGMIAYDLLSVGKSLPRHRMLSRDETLAREPALDPAGLRGGALYYDCQVPFAERLVLENVVDARRHGAVVRTYHRVESATPLVPPSTDQGQPAADCPLWSLRLRDTLTGAAASATARVLINATGAWVDLSLGTLAAAVPLLAPGRPLMGGTKGSHIVVAPFEGAPETAIYAEAAGDNRPFFIIRWNGLVLIGTTDERFEGGGDPREARAGDDEIDYLLASVNRVLPSAGLTREQVLFTFSGVRPLPASNDSETGAITRRHVIHEHRPESGAPAVSPPLLSIVGRKLTTFRSLAEEVIDKVGALLERELPECATATSLLPGAPGESGALPGDSPQFSDTTLRHLHDVYGASASDIIRLASDDPFFAPIIDPCSGAIAAEVVYAARHEFARTPDDVLFRRTMIGFGPDHGAEARPIVESLLAHSSSP
ncbi:MAG: glycerol-3-phosphate dehydrogenase/oxidase [Phycisphaerales bacterium]|nr:glycerol-3-phosphate dehydrogenase/oxidase [Phycisphaerales bacterium]